MLADPRLRALAELRRDPFLPVPDPRLRVLQATPAQFRAVQVTLDP
ncbi:MAG TPA: Vms1/Ankzf1 family peptidyl-tRNA hydrolase [Thermoanaerobaculia bacterium]